MPSKSNESKKRSLLCIPMCFWFIRLTKPCNHYIQFSSAQSLSHVWLFVTPWIAARQASLSITNPGSWLKLMSIESVMPSSHLILCYPLLLLPPIPPSIRVFSNESTLCMMWPKYWSFSFSIIPSKEHPGLITLAPIFLQYIAFSQVSIWSWIFQSLGSLGLQSERWNLFWVKTLFSPNIV